MAKIVVVVRGGLVESVYTDDENAEVKLIDCDVLKDEMGKSHQEITEIINKNVGAMKDNFIGDVFDIEGVE